jgi:integrase
MGLYPRLDHKKGKKTTDKNETIRVVIDYYYGGKRTKITTGVFCLMKDWDSDWRKKPSKNPIKTTDKDYRGKNLLIRNKISEIENIVLSLQKQDKEPIVELVKSYLRKEKNERKTETSKELHFLPLLTQYEKWINSPLYPNRESTRKGINTSIKQIREFSTLYQNKNHFLLFPEDLDDDFMTEFISWSYEEKGLQPSTIRKRIKTFTTFSSWSKEKYGTTFHIRKPKGFVLDDSTKDIYSFTKEEVIKLYNYDKFNYENQEHVKTLTEERRLTYLQDKWTHSKKGEVSRTYTTFEVYKDMLVFLTNVGCRWGDLVEMKVGDLVYDDVKNEKGITMGYFSYYMGKIKNQKNSTKVPRNKITYEIYKKYVFGKELNHFIFPRTIYGNSISNQKFNEYIKEVCRIVGLNRRVRKTEWNLKGEQKRESTDFIPLYEVISSHIGRRTFIRRHIESGTPTRTIMKMTGHKSRKVFDGYYEVYDEDLKYMNDDLFSEDLETPKTTLNSYKTPQPNKETTPFSKEQIEKIEKLKYSLDEGWINQEKFDELFQKILLEQQTI